MSPRLDLVVGCHDAGKSTLIERHLQPVLRVLYVNADEIATQRWPDDPREFAAQRVRLRASSGGHSVPERKIRERYQRVRPLAQYAGTRSDQATIYSNERVVTRVLARCIDGVTVDEPQWPTWAPTVLTSDRRRYRRRRVRHALLELGVGGARGGDCCPVRTQPHASSQWAPARIWSALLRSILVLTPHAVHVVSYDEPSGMIGMKNSENARLRRSTRCAARLLHRVGCIYGGGAWTNQGRLSDGSFQEHRTCAALRAEQLARYPYV